MIIDDQGSHCYPWSGKNSELLRTRSRVEGTSYLLMGTSKYCHYPGCLEKPHAHPLHVQIRLMTDIHDLKAG
ncbi:hypothetical protein ICNINCKA_00743 [Synechococcus sp. CBW1107]|nr:hypothetical protein ICNINCKA_00743 [Synechococcus sp. CBW1107]